MNREETRKAAMVMLAFAGGRDIIFENNSIADQDPEWLWCNDPDRFRIAPYKARKGEEVLVRNLTSETWSQRTFVVYHNGRYYCEHYLNNDMLVDWKECKPLK